MFLSTPHPLANFFAPPVIFRLRTMAVEAAAEEPDVADRIRALMKGRVPVAA